MKVLLISPTPASDPAGGDVTYTQSLLETPPSGVEYTLYDEAIRSGVLIEHWRRPNLTQSIRDLRPVDVVRESCGIAVSKVLGALRRRDHLLWEPTRVFSVKPGVFDLVHVHIFPSVFRQLDVPLVYGCGGPWDWLYRDAREWSEGKFQRAERREQQIARAIGTNRANGPADRADLVVTYTRESEAGMLQYDLLEASKIRIIPPGVPLGPRRVVPERPHRVAFIARNFEHKGGDLAIAAFKIARESRADLEMHVLGCDRPEDRKHNDDGVDWHGYVTREELLNDWLPKTDLLVYPTRYDYVPLTPLEAIARGVPVAATDYRAMREIVGNDAGGLVSPPGDAHAMATNILRLLDPPTNARMADTGREHLTQQFESSCVAARWRAVYDEALSGKEVLDRC